MKTNITSTSSEYELIKYTGAIHISNELSLFERKLNNILNLNAQDKILENESHFFPLSGLKQDVDFKKSNNYQYIYDSLDQLVGTKVKINILGKDNKVESMAVTTLLSEARVVKRGKESYCRYSYSPLMRQLYAKPGMYGKLNLLIQKEITKKTTMALWEYLIDCAGRATSMSFVTDELTVDQCRNILIGNEETYPEFKRFSDRVLKPAIKELNSLSIFKSLTVEYVKKGKKVVGVKFFVVKTSQNSMELPNINIEDDFSSDFDPEIMELLVSKKVSKSVAEKAAQEYTKNYVEANIKYVDDTYKDKATPPLYLRAVQENYACYDEKASEEENTSQVEIQQFPKNDLWEAVVEKIQETMTRDEYKRWFVHLQCESIDDNKVTLYAANKNIRDYALMNYADKIQEAFAVVHSQKVTLEINKPEEN